ncbi:MAG: hypothetical protein ACLQVG_30060 [Terriglobia bacterium]
MKMAIGGDLGRQILGGTPQSPLATIHWPRDVTMPSFRQEVGEKAREATIFMKIKLLNGISPNGPKTQIIESKGVELTPVRCGSNKDVKNEG